jgi:polysaccharide export outer membrane protein
MGSLILFLLLAQETPPNLPAQPVGANDLLAVSVYSAPELTRTVRISETGLIRLPMLRQTIQARGLMPSELEERIAAALTEEEILVDPVVTVTVAEYHSRPISVAGAVRHPLTFQASGKTTLLQALTRAEGLSPEAGTEILITRPAAAEIEHVAVRGLIDGADAALNLTLEGGEEIRVPQAGRFFVVGNVKKPGAFPVDEAFGMTVLKALALAEGLTPFAAREAYIYRPGEGQPGQTPIPLRKILDRKVPDAALRSNEILYIPDNRSARATKTGLERALGFVAATGSGLLIYSHP